MRLIIDLQGAQGANRWRGIGRYCRELALAMIKESRGHEVLVALNGNSALMDSAEELRHLLLDFLPQDHIRIWEPLSGLQSKIVQRDFSETLRTQFLASLQPDLVLVESIFEHYLEDIVTLSPPHLERIPTVGICYDLIPMIRHDSYFGPGAQSSIAARWYYRCATELSLCDGILAISEASRNDAIRYLAYPEERVFNILTGISPRFRPSPLSPEQLRYFLQRYGLRRSFILYLGAGESRKNEKGLLTAYASLPQVLRKQHQLAIIGKVDVSFLHRHAAEHGIAKEDYVFIDFVPEDDLNALYTHCGLFVYPSLHEGFGLPLGEAMACGAPAIASNTSSLPEVIGREDATFNPENPDAIAACMRKVLENPTFRQELAAHGPVQAGRFTWQASAARAWDALETIHARRIHRGKTRVTAMLPKRPRLAFVSPLPPQASGIADYSAELVPSLARHYDITLVSEEDTTDHRLWAFPRLTPAQFLSQVGAFDRVVYQVGNSSFHQLQLKTLIPQCPGVIVLHEAFLSNVIEWMANTCGQLDDFPMAVLQSHGYPALRFLIEQGPAATMQHYSCSIYALQNAVGIIQHSRHGISILRQHFSEEAVQGIVLIPHLRADRQKPDRTAARNALGLDEDTFVVCTFGYVTSHKRPELLAQAWRLSGIQGRLVFVGDSGNRHNHLADPAVGIGVIGRVSREDHGNWLAAADLAVQLRSNSRGESSGSIADVLMAGVALIINRHGSAAELPEGIVWNLPDDTDAHDLARALVALHDDPDRRKALGTAGRSYARREWNTEVIADRYAQAIEEAYARPGAVAVTHSMKPHIQSMADREDDVRSVALSIVNSFPSPWRGGGRARLLVDISALASDSAPLASGAHSAQCAVALRVLETPPQSYRGEAVRFHDGKIVCTYSIPLAMLELPPLTLTETFLHAGCNDILLYMDINKNMSSGELSELRRLRLNGLKIVIACFDPLPLLAQTHNSVSVTNSFREIFGIADGVVCASLGDADRLMAWLDGQQDCRKTALPIGFCSSTAGPPTANLPIDWDERYRQLCNIVLTDHWDRTWKPYSKAGGKTQ